jgi:hypothetical protein
MEVDEMGMVMEMRQLMMGDDVAARMMPFCKFPLRCLLELRFLRVVVSLSVES